MKKYIFSRWKFKLFTPNSPIFTAQSIANCRNIEKSLLAMSTEIAAPLFDNNGSQWLLSLDIMFSLVLLLSQHILNIHYI